MKMNKIKAAEIAKKYRERARNSVPRGVFMFLFFMFLLLFASSVFAGAGLSVFGVLASSEQTYLFAPAAFFAIEFLFLFCGLILHYGLFLCSLRFVRNQPVALSFLFAGFKQKRAKKFAAFFIIPIVLAFAVTMLPAASSFNLPEVSTPEALVDFLAGNNEFFRMFVFRMTLFFVVALALYFPFTFAWPLVYDGIKKSFRELFCHTLRFFKGRVLNFLRFQIICHYKAVILFVACNFFQYLIVKNFSMNAVAQIAFSFFSIVCFFATTILCASVILAINFYYDFYLKENESNENPHEENSN